MAGADGAQSRGMPDVVDFRLTNRFGECAPTIRASLDTAHRQRAARGTVTGCASESPRLPVDELMVSRES